MPEPTRQHDNARSGSNGDQSKNSDQSKSGEQSKKDTASSNDKSNDKDSSSKENSGKSSGDDNGSAGSKNGDSGKPKESKEKEQQARKDKDQVDEPLPSTMSEWFQRLSKPKFATPEPVTQPVTQVDAQPAKVPVKQPVKQAAKEPAATEASKAKAAATSPAATISRATRRDGLTLMPLPAREVMAVKLSTESLKRAVAAGFVVRATNLGVTTFIAPDNLLNQSALDKLRQVLPDEKLGNNQQYRIYRTATGVAAPAEADTEKPATPMQTPCGTDRCFGPSAINWKTEFRECARSVRIGIIDTGHDAKHPAFEKRTIETMQIAAAERSKAPDWHGTGVLALLAGESKSATPGLIPDAKFYLADIFYSDTDGQPISDTASLLEALEWLKTKHVKIVNLSLTGPPDDVLKEVLDDLSRNGMIIVAAAGNDGPTKQPRHPAAYPSVISVTAVSKDLRSYRFANRGERIDIAAPGVDIWTAMPGGRAGYHSGTSFAVPYVTAVLATVFRDLPEKSKSAFLDLATKEAKDLGDKGRDQTYGIGLLQAPATCQSRPVVAAVKAAPATPSLVKTLPSPTWPATVIQVRNQP